MELAYADAFDIPIFVLLHQLTFRALQAMEEGVPPLLLKGQCNPSSQWKAVAVLRRRLGKQARTGSKEGRMAKVKKPTNVFISYARADAPKLDVILKNLIASGLIEEKDRILKEEDLPAKHEALREEVKKRIQSSSKLIVVWGTASASSQWVNYEIGLADALGKPIIAVIPKKDAVALPANLQNVEVVEVESDG